MTNQNLTASLMAVSRGMTFTGSQELSILRMGYHSAAVSGADGDRPWGRELFGRDADATPQWLQMRTVTNLQVSATRWQRHRHRRR